MGRRRVAEARGVDGHSGSPNNSGGSSLAEAILAADFRGTCGSAAGAGPGARGTPRHCISGSSSSSTTRRPKFFPAGIGSGRSAGSNSGGSSGRNEAGRHHRSCLSEEEHWGGFGVEGVEGDQLRLRALKSVCKRKVTEKGLVRHMETVSTAVSERDRISTRLLLS